MSMLGRCSAWRVAAVAGGGGGGGVDVWDEPPFVPRQGHRSSTHNVDTPQTARSAHLRPPPLAAASPRRVSPPLAGPAAVDRPPSAPGRLRQKRLLLCVFSLSFKNTKASCGFYFFLNTPPFFVVLAV